MARTVLRAPRGTRQPAIDRVHPRVDRAAGIEDQPGGTEKIDLAGSTCREHRRSTMTRPRAVRECSPNQEVSDVRSHRTSRRSLRRRGHGRDVPGRPASQPFLLLNLRGSGGAGERHRVGLGRPGPRSPRAGCSPGPRRTASTRAILQVFSVCFPAVLLCAIAIRRQPRRASSAASAGAGASRSRATGSRPWGSCSPGSILVACCDPSRRAERRVPRI